MSRFFAFGCSFTGYKWPTWADILGQEFDEYQNWGRNGAGNQYIFHSLVEANQRSKFTPDDTVVVMWTTLDREDRYLRGEWFTHGSIYHNTYLPKEFVKQFADDRWSILRDVTCMSAVKSLLDHWGVTYHFLNMVPFEFSFDQCVEPINDIVQEFKPLLDITKPSMFEKVMGSNFNSNFSIEEYNVFAGSSWPTFENFMQGDNGSELIADEVKEFRDRHLPKVNYREIDPSAVERDHHPRPLQHLAYLELVLPDYKISQKTKDWVKLSQQKVLDKNFSFPEIEKAIPKRF